MTFKTLLLGGAMLALAACGSNTPVTETTSDQTEVVIAEPVNHGATLDAILDAQSDDMKARYAARNPAETLMFFGIEPGMTVVEALPHGGWYSKILLPYLGDDGKLIGVNYSTELWANFDFATEAFLTAQNTWVDTYKTDAAGWSAGSQAEVDGFAFGGRNPALDGTADAALFIRALHNLNRFSTDEMNYIGQSLDDAHALLKSGGILGVVQHRAPDSHSDSASDGSTGYLKQDALIALIESHGFKLVDTSEVNANPKDTPAETDIVWRLPPTLGTSAEDEALRATLLEVGESDRMTLKFIKI